MACKKGALVQNVIYVDARLEPLDALSRSEFDVTLSEAHKFDMYQVAHPQSGLPASGLMLPVGFNLGFVSTQEHAALLNQVENAIAVLPENGALHKAARGAWLPYGAPASSAAGSGLGLEKTTQELESLSRLKSRENLKQSSKFQKIFRRTSTVVVMRQSSDSVS